MERGERIDFKLIFLDRNLNYSALFNTEGIEVGDVKSSTIDRPPLL